MRPTWFYSATFFVLLYTDPLSQNKSVLCFKIGHKLKLFKNKMQEKYRICEKTILYIGKNVKLLKHQILGFAYLE